MLSKLLDLLFPARPIVKALDRLTETLKHLQLNTIKQSTYTKKQPNNITEKKDDIYIKIHTAGSDIEKNKMVLSGKLKTERGDKTASDSAKALSDIKNVHI